MPEIIDFKESELIIALIGAVGTDLSRVSEPLKNKLRYFNYDPIEIRVSQDVIKPLFNEEPPAAEGDRIAFYMDKGNEARHKANDKAVLASGIAANIYKIRQETGTGEPLRKKAFIIKSIKTPEEIQRLREIYQTGFYAISVHTEKDRRKNNLLNKTISDSQAELLIMRDEEESDTFGQHTRDAFHLSDFFVNYDGNEDRITNSINRIIDIIFGDPYRTPTFDEFAMFMAFSSALRSADLSRQVGAVITREQSIISTGANDVPKFGGGVYWPQMNPNGTVTDNEDGRDFKRGFDSNSKEKHEIIADIAKKLASKIDGESITFIKQVLSESKIKDITEYGRVVHAEMDAILSCARNGLSTAEATLYCTTFPCHNCAKHVITSGIRRVVYIEPYPKSKAIDFHKDSISPSKEDHKNKVIFEPFVGVGPRRFFDLFSMNLSDGFPIKRKNSDGTIMSWPADVAPPLRIQMYPLSYIEKETIAVNDFKIIIDQFSQGEKA